jgi:hypothetical protein
MRWRSWWLQAKAFDKGDLWGERDFLKKVFVFYGGGTFREKFLPRTPSSKAFTRGILWGEGLFEKSPSPHTPLLKNF